jgi:sugar lactone lactonase YvrE
MTRTLVRNALPLFCLGGAASCAPPADQPAADTAAALPTWTWDSTMIFPADRSLNRPEDGVALPDGRLIVADQVSGLRLIELDGTGRPFGDFAEAGYTHHPPTHPGGANGVSLEPGGTHVLVADVLGGVIYRVEIATGKTEKLYQHQYGVNTAIRDSRGTVWFTQSAHNRPEDGEARMWQSVDIARPEGALYRLPVQGNTAGTAQLLVDSLLFANGIAIDEGAGYLYVSESTGGRVLRYRVDLDAGRLSERTVLVDSIGPDNLELDGAGNLWIAIPFTNELLVVNPATGVRHSAFRSHTPEQAAVIAEFIRRGQTGAARMELFTPAMWSPLPGLLTGVIVGPTGPVYATGLGNALVKLDC